MNDLSTAITHVRVFDGQGLTDPQTIVIEHGAITSVSPTSATTEASVTAQTRVDGQGATLLPGLIDSHVHIMGPDDALRAARSGVTTLLDMATPRPDLLLQARGRPGLPDIRTAGIPASGVGGMQTTRMGFPQSSVVTGPGDAERFVAERVAERSDYIKIIVEDPQMMGPAALDGPTIAAIVQASHARGLRVFAHVTTLTAVRLAADAGVDVLTHAPVDAPVGADLVAALAARGAISVPTLVMMRAVTSLRGLPTHGSGANFHNAELTVAAFQRAGVAVIAGTDANMAPGSPFTIVHGESLHDELELLVAAGLTPLDTLRSATTQPAKRFDLGDRGAIEPGRRADLLLVTGDPTTDIRATRNIQGVWIAGVRVR